MKKRIALHLGLIIGALALGLSVSVSPVFAGAQGADGYVKQIIGFNADRTPITRGIPGIWVKWTDAMGNYRFALSDNDGYFRFYSWQNTLYINNSNWSAGVEETYCDENDSDCWGDVGQGYWRQTQCTSAIGAPVSSFYTVKSGGVCDGNGFGCSENPHDFTIVNPPAGLTGCTTAIRVPEIVNTTLIPRSVGEFRYTATTCTYVDPTPTPTPTQAPTATPVPGEASLGSLVIDAAPDTSAITAGPTYGVSGLRTTQGGRNVYNAIKVVQNINNGGSNNNISLAGVGFTSKSLALPATNSILELTRKAVEQGGFILLYAQRDDSARTLTAIGQESTVSFTAGNYYVYFEGNWNTISQVRDYDAPNGVMNITVRGDSTPPTSPKFNVMFFRNMGNREWATYSYLKRSNGIEVSTRSQVVNESGTLRTPQ